MKSPYLTKSLKPRRDFAKLEKRRRQGMKLLARGLSQAEVARRCGVSETSVYRWKEAQSRKGPGAWKRGRLGRPPGRRRKMHGPSERHRHGSRFSLRIFRLHA
ncbi:MAG: helix-turn-helix domain-containing protein [Verrucomicrobiales bacterium]|nr:helix-turn-helix domain-containing protein [Verrucomicrobiales bacterium]